ncbi:MAG: glycosyltransferase family 2 protein [Tannerella sp.]|jgi:GT2 family glycosyltransferase|nr:glycosyltransferase family 2 protein [Tannerella sp.]
MKLSVVIITWNAARYLGDCINSAIAATAHLDAEIIVVDNGSTDETRTMLRSFSKQIFTVQLEKNCGVAYARNVGLRHAAGEYVWILDVDTVVNREAVDGMMAYIEGDEGCGLCACRLQSADGETQDSCRRLPYLKYKIANLLAGTKARKLLSQSQLNSVICKQFYREQLLESEPFEAEYLIGACQMFRRGLIDEVGYLDENIFYGPEDADFCLRISRKGYRIVCLPAFQIIHHYNRATNRRFFSALTLRHIKGLLYFYIKNR